MFTLWAKIFSDSMQVRTVICNSATCESLIRRCCAIFSVYWPAFLMAAGIPVPKVIHDISLRRYYLTLFLM
jgi:hypothetical protein